MRNYIKLNKSIIQKTEEKDAKIKNLSVERDERLNSQCPFRPKLNNSKNIKSDKLNLSFKERIKVYKVKIINLQDRMINQKI